MALTKIPRGLLDTGVADSSDATAITISSSENVGIGEPSPTAKLHITVADNTEFLKATITGQEHWAFKGASGLGATDYVSFGISGGIQAMAWQEDGMVGIGTTSPDINSFGTGHGVLTVQSATGSAKTAMLNLSGDGNDTDATRVASLFFNDASATGAGKSLAGVEAYRASNHATDPGGDLLFSTNVSGGSYTERMRIKADGKVGIGTNDVGTSKINIYTGNVTGAGTLASSAINIAHTTHTNGMSQMTFGYQPGSLTYAAAYIGYIGVSQAGNGNGDLVFGTRTATSDTQPTERMRIQADGTVGIGTTSLTAWGSGYKSLQIGDRGYVAAHTGSDLYLGQNAYVNSGWKYEASVAASLTQHSGGQITHFVAAAGTAGNAISWTTAMHIDTGGRVGIKTNAEADGTAMTSPLTISGANDGGNIFEAHRTGNSIHRQYMSTGGSSYIDIYGTTPILKIRTGGNDHTNFTAAGITGNFLYASTNEYTSSMNNLKTTGFYRVQNQALDQPISGNYGAACVFGNQGNVTTQIWSQLQTSNLYVRSFNNAWSSWTAL